MTASKMLAIAALGSALVLTGCGSRATNRGPGGNTTGDRGSLPPGGGDQNTPADPGAVVTPNAGSPRDRGTAGDRSRGEQANPGTGTNPGRANPAGTRPTGRR
jgi:hypothetical protein